jgi:hypothetical protein
MKDDAVEIISKSTTQVGGVTVNFTVGRIKPTSPKGTKPQEDRK